MNAVNPVPSSTAPGATSPAAEPSMEEILASIRRIIADDQSLPGRSNLDAMLPKPAHDRAEGEPEAQDMRHILRSPGHDGTGSSERAPGAAAEPRDALPHTHGAIAPQFISPGGPSGVAPETAGVAEAKGKPAAFPTQREEPTLSSHGPDLAEARDALFSAATDSSVKAAFSTLAATRIIDNSDELMELARDMIRPLLKAWIDEHLPGLVERMVIAEIERIARRGR